MIFRDLREAESALFGGPSFSMLIKTDDRPERLNDMAQAWIDGRHDEVMAYVAAHKANVRARATPVNPKPLRRILSVPDNERDALIVRLIERGKTYREIQKELGVSPNTISRLRHAHLVT